jgi:hypothetical protein
MMFTDLSPNEFDWIEFGSVCWEAINMQATMISSDKLLGLRADMNLVVVPDQNNLAWDQAKQMTQKGNCMNRAETARIGTDSQSHMSHVRADQKRSEQVQALAMVQTGTRSRRLSARRPTALERRHQRETALIYEYQGRSQGAPLFLSLAKHDDANWQSLHYCVGAQGAVPFGNSSSCDPEHARRRLACNEL